MQWLLQVVKCCIIEMHCKIGQIKLLNDFELQVKKHEYVQILVRNEENHEILFYKLFKLIHHYLKVSIEHEKLNYSGYMQICAISEYESGFAMHLSFEP